MAQARPPPPTPQTPASAPRHATVESSTHSSLSKQI